MFFGWERKGHHRVERERERVWPSLQDKSLFRGVFHLCGVFDVRPLLPTTIAAPLRLSGEAEAAANSPLWPPNAAAAAANCRGMRLAALYYGEHDAPGLIRQGREYEKVTDLHELCIYLFIFSFSPIDFRFLLLIPP